tara:strand:+ start:6052 stop:7380 length:1329 start_codon:yes stop_codon:yes gene_type:complete
MNQPLSTSKRCELLLTEWRRQLILSNYEYSQLKNELNKLDGQIKRLKANHVKIAVFGKVGVGKSSLLNALLNKEVFATDITHGSTQNIQFALWNESIKFLDKIELIDTPGIDEMNEEKSLLTASQISSQSDLVLFVLDSDMTNVELEALKALQNERKPVLLILNRCDQWDSYELKELIKSIKNRLPNEAKNLPIQTVSAAPRQSKILFNGKARSQKCPPSIEGLREYLITLLNEQGRLIMSLNSLRHADSFYRVLKAERLKKGKLNAQSLIGKFAVLKASGVAVNPLLLLDFTASLACDTALVVQLSKLYGLQLQGPAARELLKRLSIYSAYLGGAQVCIQLALGTLRQLLLITAPFTGGISLASTAPVALVQAALAIHTTKLTGRLAAKELLKGVHKRGAQPSAMLRRITTKDPDAKALLNVWPDTHTSFSLNLTSKSLLP